MTLTRTRRKALIIGAVIAVVAVGLFTVSQLSRSTFPGTDVEYFTATSESDSEDCGNYAGDLQSLVRGTQLIVVATVTSEQPLFEPVYGTDLPREVDGEMPARRGDYLGRALQLDIERVRSGNVPESLDVRAEGWVARSTSDIWNRHVMYGSPFLSVGDRAVVPMYRLTDHPSGQPIYVVSCTGAFVIDDGMVSARPDGRQFKDDGVYSMSEQELIAAIKRYAG